MFTRQLDLGKRFAEKQKKYRIFPSVRVWMKFGTRSYDWTYCVIEITFINYTSDDRTRVINITHEKNMTAHDEPLIIIS